MSEQPLQGAQNGEKLESWKEIATYLRRDVRTVRRWEKSEGLPVHRHVHQKLASVYAYKQELDAWARNRTPAELNGTGPRKRRWVYAWVLAAVLMPAAAGIAWLLLRNPPSLAPPVLSAAIPVRLLAAASGDNTQPVTIPVGLSLGGAVLTPDERELVVSDYAGKALHVIDTATNSVVRSIPLPLEPGTLVMTREGVLYVAFPAGELHAVDLQSGKTRVLVADMPRLSDLALSNDGRKLYLVAPFVGMKTLDTRTEEVRSVPTVRCPMYLAVPGKNLLFVNHQCGGPQQEKGADVTDVRNTLTDEGVGVIQAEPHVGGTIAASADGSQVWSSANDVCVAAQYDHSKCAFAPGGLIRAYRTDDRQLLATLAFPLSRDESQPGGIAFTPDSSRAVVTNRKLRVFDTSSMRAVEEMMLDGLQAVFTRDGRRMYVVLAEPPSIAMFELSPAKCLKPSTDLVSWWTGDGNAEDLRNGNPGQMKNGAHAAPAWSGQGFHLDGRDDFVLVQQLSHAPTFEDFTLAMWVKPAGAPGDRGPLADYLAIPNDEASGWRLERLTDGRVSFCFNPPSRHPCPLSSNTAVSKRPLESQRWSHVVVVRSGEHITLYLDGRAESSAVAARSPNQTERGNLRLGADRLERRFFRGMLDEVQYYNAPLSAERTQQLFAAGRAGLCYR